MRIYIYCICVSTPLLSATGWPRERECLCSQQPVTTVHSHQSVAVAAPYLFLFMLALPKPTLGVACNARQGQRAAAVRAALAQ